MSISTSQNPSSTPISKILLAGERLLKSRSLFKILSRKKLDINGILNSRIFRTVASPLPLITSEFLLVNKTQDLLQAPSIPHTAIVLVSLYMTGFWAVLLTEAGRNVKFSDLSIFKRKNHATALQAIKKGDLDKLKAIPGIKYWNWKSFANFAKSSPSETSISPLDLAVKKENWAIVAWLLQQGATPTFPISSKGQKNNFQAIDALSGKEREDYRVSQKTWEALVFKSPLDVLTEALRSRFLNEQKSEKEKLNDVMSILLTKVDLESAPQTAITIFNKAPDLFNLDELKEMLPGLLNEEKDSPALLDLLILMQSKIEKENLKVNLSNPVKKVSLSKSRL